jgi:hypothetical protein
MFSATDISALQIIAATLFGLAVLHTFCTKYFIELAHRYPRHGGLFHLLGEVEVVFGFWAAVLILFIAVYGTTRQAVDYLDSRNFTEPMFVFVIMVIAASRPIFELAGAAVRLISRALPFSNGVSMYFISLFIVPLLGSFITEPAAMTLAALLLRDSFYKRGISERLKYATLGVLFVNISIGGTLTHFAAPPVLMVAGAWGWDLSFMLRNFGMYAAIAAFINALGATLLFRKELHRLNVDVTRAQTSVPLSLTLLHLVLLTGVVAFAHYPPVFIALFLFFLGVVTAYERHQSPLILREGLMVAFFLAGLVTLGGLQQWWLSPMLRSMSADTVYFGATGLTAIFDNAALTYLGSLVEGLSDEFKRSLVAGAVIGGGLTVIANAPNPAGFAILRENFAHQNINALGLFAAALLPTLVALLVFKL